MMTVAIIDDEISIADSISQTLKKENWSVTTYYSGDAYINDKPKKQFDLVIVDLSMPNITGMTLLQKHIPKKQNVIVISGFINNILGNELFNSPNIKFLEKPFVPPQLLTLIDTMLFS